MSAKSFTFRMSSEHRKILEGFAAKHKLKESDALRKLMELGAKGAEYDAESVTVELQKLSVLVGSLNERLASTEQEVTNISGAVERLPELVTRVSVIQASPAKFSPQTLQLYAEILLACRFLLAGTSQDTYQKLPKMADELATKMGKDAESYMADILARLDDGDEA